MAVLAEVKVSLQAASYSFPSAVARCEETGLEAERL